LGRRIQALFLPATDCGPVCTVCARGKRRSHAARNVKSTWMAS